MSSPETAAPHRVLVADPLSEAGVAALAAQAQVDVRVGLDHAALLAAIGDYDAIVVRSQTTVDAEVIAAGHRLKVIARAGIGLDNVDVDAATARGVLVCNAPQSNVISAAEHTVALLLALARRIPEADASLRSGHWERERLEGVELAGKTLGILGLGRVGRLVAQRCSAFGMKLVAFDPYITDARAAGMGVHLVHTVAEVCEVADVLTVHLPKTAETLGIVGEAELKAMKPSARLVNTARGGLVDEAALHTALTEGWIAGAALDVFATEPVTRSPLFGLPNLVVTPHLGASTTEAQDKAGTMVAQAVLAALAGDFVPSAVNVAVGGGIPETLKPWMPLVATLGRLLVQLEGGVCGDVVLELFGRIAEEDNTQPLTLAAFQGLLTDVVHEPVTFVNAPLLAEERGLRVSTLSAAVPRDFVSLVRLRCGETAVGATLVGLHHRPRLVEVWGYGVDMDPADHMAFFLYQDRPGIVGLIGGRLGEAGVNIASMQVGRDEAGGRALIAMAVDSAIPAGVEEEIAEAIGAVAVRTVDLA